MKKMQTGWWMALALAGLIPGVTRGQASLTGLGVPEGEEAASVAAQVSSDGGAVVGSEMVFDEVWGKRTDRPVRWQNGQRLAIPLPENSTGRASGVSIQGVTVVGTFHRLILRGPDGQPMGIAEWKAMMESADESLFENGLPDMEEYQGPFRWTPVGGFEALPMPEGTRSWVATAVSANGGVVVGQMSMEAGGSEAFVWDAANGMRSVKSVLAAANGEVGEWRLDIAMGVSADGRTLVGAGVHPAGRGEAWRAVLPAP